MPLQHHSHPGDSPIEYWITDITHGTVGYTTGLSATERPELPGYNSGVLCLTIAMLLFVIFNARNYGRFFHTLVNNLWSVRTRTNLFDEHTVNETGLMGALIAQVCVYEALLAVCCMFANGYSFSAVSMGAMVGLAALFTGGYYVAQLIVYKIIGYAFTTRNLSSQWIQGFNSSQTLLGFALLLPAMISLFYPAAVNALCGVSIALYVIARIVFICKGFRIFYHNLFSLVYFILYLCSVEIIPLLIIHQWVISFLS
jgi:hypothetical protein